MPSWKAARVLSFRDVHIPGARFFLVRHPRRLVEDAINSYNYTYINKYIHTYSTIHTVPTAREWSIMRTYHGCHHLDGIQSPFGHAGVNGHFVLPSAGS